jgi:cytochrome c-type biogenesis protein CcmH/NrfF
MIPPVLGRPRSSLRPKARSFGSVGTTMKARLAFPILLLSALSFSRSALAQSSHEQGANAPNLAAAPLGIDLSKTPSLTPEQLDLARAIGRDLVCLCDTCPKEPISDCRCGWAEMNRKIIQLSLQAGKTKDEILAAYVSVYDLEVRGTPPDEGLGRASYLVPYAFGLVMLLSFIGYAVRMRRRQPMAAVINSSGAQSPTNEPISADDRAELKKELEDLD